MRSYFFNAEPTDDLVNHPTGYDREYDADSQAEFFAPFFSEKGVMAGTDANACKVSVKEGNTLQFAAGAVYIRGRMAVLEGNETITVSENCKIVCRMNKTSEVRAFQLLAVQEPVSTNDICDLELASVSITAVPGGYEASVTDTRTFLRYMGQPAYYPPGGGSIPYTLWLYALGFPLDGEQRAAIEENPSLMSIFNGFLGAARAQTVVFAAGDWTAADSSGLRTLAIPRTQHGRPSERFGYTLRHQVNGQMTAGTWAVRCTDVVFDEDSGAVSLRAPDAYAGEIVFFAS